MSNVSKCDSSRSSHAYFLWLLTLAYALHAMEEQAFNWIGWAHGAGLSYDWPDFYMANISVVLFGITASMVGWKLPAFSLGFPALAGVNALIFHIAASIVAGRPNPGFLTAVVLFLPLVSACIIGARRDGILSTRVLVTALIVGIAVHSVPLLLLGLKPSLTY